MGIAEHARADAGDGATAVASPAARRKAGEDGAAASLATMAETSAHVIRTDEAARALALSRGITFLSGVGLCAVPFLYDRGRALFWPAAANMVALFLTSGWMWWRAVRARGHSRAVFRLFVAVAAGTGLFMAYDLGVFSPAPLFLALGVVFIAQSHDCPFAVGATVFSAAAYAVLALLVIAGVVPDLGVFSAAAGPLSGRLLFVVMVPVAYGVAGWQGRQSRRATLAAIAETQQALRLALTREAQLAEANQNLDVALNAGAGSSGRYTDARMGSYRLAEIIGRGAMGEIYAASDVDTGAPAAVKVLQASVCRDPDLVERFFREGRIAKSLQAPNVVTVFDVGGAEDGVPFIAMELLVGEDLSARLRHRERLDLPATLDLVDEVSLGLAAAHAAGVVHRDLKPQNIFCAEQPRGQPPVWKILDFGVSKLRDAFATITHAAVIGTPGYMSPEQAQGTDTDHRSDIFALGAVTYRALTGRPPFGGEMPHVLFEIAYKSPTCASELCPSLPPDVDLVLAIALAKRAGDRFDSAPEMAAALRDAARGALDPALRARAAALIEEAPWGVMRQAA